MMKIIQYRIPKAYTLPVLLALVMLTSCNYIHKDSGEKAGAGRTPNQEYLARSMQIFDSIYSHYYLPEKDLFSENYPALGNDNEVSWLWPYTCLSAGVNCLMKAGVQDDRLIRIIDGFEKYFDSRAVPGYASYPFELGSAEKYYDDNAIVGIELMDAWEITGEKKYLDRAENAMHFIFTGESKECGGGIYWNENEFGKTGEKGISANGFGTYLALKIYQATGEEQYLIFARRIYKWVVENLKNPENQVYWNGILVADCSVRKDIWVYNTGIMILNSLLFYEITGDDSYLQEAGNVAAASYEEFTRETNGIRNFIYDLPWFKTVLLKSYIALAEYDEKADEYIRTFEADIEKAWKTKMNPHGLIAEDWTGEKPGGDTQLLNQSCIVEIYARLAIYRAGK